MAALSRIARDSAKTSAIKSNLRFKNFEKDTSGVPIPSGGVFWSVSHKPRVVAGVVSTVRIGIDIEQVKPVSEQLTNRIMDAEECRLFRGVERSKFFFQVFTAKEAVLKKTGDGIRGLVKAKVIKVMGDKNLLVEYLNRKYFVENFYFDGYLAAVTKNDCEVQWTVI
ncbi:MAG: 4'-phosphopantetheinyl transferase superfamily protein [Desulfobacula sp.]|nr:4'-phosphopantetheinyl transferase superfamily protein [Desulfobacula sp.]